MEINVEVFSSPRQYETNEHKKTKPIETCWPNQRKKRPKTKNQKKKRKSFRTGPDLPGLAPNEPKKTTNQKVLTQ